MNITARLLRLFRPGDRREPRACAFELAPSPRETFEHSIGWCARLDQLLHLLDSIEGEIERVAVQQRQLIALLLDS